MLSQAPAWERAKGRRLVLIVMKLTLFYFMKYMLLIIVRSDNIIGFLEDVSRKLPENELFVMELATAYREAKLHHSEKKTWFRLHEILQDDTLYVEIAKAYKFLNDTPNTIKYCELYLSADLTKESASDISWARECVEIYQNYRRSGSKS